MFVADIHAYLRTALPDFVPVLLPEQFQIPAEWQEETPDGDLLDGGRVGLMVYLEQHAPDGYVQIEQPAAIGSDSLMGTFWVAVAAIASEPEQAQELALTVRRLLAGWSYAPGHYREVTAGTPLFIEKDVWVCRFTYEAKTLDGLTV